MTPTTSTAIGSEAGTVTTSWSVDDGLRLNVPRPEGGAFTIPQARELLADLQAVLARYDWV